MKRTIVFCVLMICCLSFSMQAQDNTTATDATKSELKDAPARTADDLKVEKKISVAESKEAGIKAQKVDAVVSKEAVVHVPSLNEERAKEIAMMLKEVEGVQNMKPDFEKKNIHVIFSADKLDFGKAVMDPLTKLDPESKLVETKDLAAAPAGKCGGCPSRAKCAGAEAAKTGTSVKEGETKVEEKSTKAGC